MTSQDLHGGELVARALAAAGIGEIYTLIGGHIFGVLDGAATEGLRLVDVRHEQAAGFAAEATGKLARRPGVVVTDAGPGVLNTPNTVASAMSNGAPLLLLAGRPPRGIWGMGALNETDQLPVFAPITKSATSVNEAARIAPAVADALALAGTAHRGPVYLDIPMDVLLERAPSEVPVPERAERARDGDAEQVAKLLHDAERPLLFLGSDVWADHAEQAARALAERHGIPVVMNGMGRGILPSDHRLAVSAARGAAFKRADLVIVAGVSLDFRVGYGHAFGGARVAQIADHPDRISRHAPLTTAVAGPLAELLDAIADAPVRTRDGLTDELRGIEAERRQSQRAELSSDASPIHPVRVYGELAPRLSRDAIVIADGGDFASYAGKFLDIYEPGAWLDPGPYGCLGTSAGYALAAGTLYPGRQVVVLLGDGAAGFSLADWDSLVRHGVDVTFVCGNNAGWMLEKEPMRGIYGRDLIADLRPETRYDEVMRAFGGHGELVKDAGEIGPALDRAFATSGPSLVNVITDPTVAYPRGGSAA